jgi:hydrogenase maturation protease
LGNDLLGDDAVGPLAVRRLEPELQGETDVIESCVTGLALLDLLIGYDRVVIIDAIHTGRFPPGAIRELRSCDLSPVAAPSPHYAGLPEMFALSESLDLEFPEEVAILAVEAQDPYNIGGRLSPFVAKSIPDLIGRVRALVRHWRTENEPCRS